jgi:DNA processing protein
VVYPRENAQLREQIRQQGALLSELPPGSPPDAGSFPRRNRLISGLSLGVVVVEAPARSGALITAACAVDQGREVFAVPGEVLHGRSAGCHRLIKEGAKLVEGAEDVLEELGCHLPQVRTQPESAASPPGPVLSLNPEEVRILGQLTGQPCDVDRLAQDLEMPPSLLLGTLLELELAGLVAQLPGKRFARTVP